MKIIITTAALCGLFIATNLVGQANAKCYGWPNEKCNGTPEPVSINQPYVVGKANIFSVKCDYGEGLAQWDTYNKECLGEVWLAQSCTSVLAHFSGGQYFCLHV